MKVNALTVSMQNIFTAWYECHFSTVCYCKLPSYVRDIIVQFIIVHSHCYSNKLVM